MAESGYGAEPQAGPPAEDPWQFGAGPTQVDRPRPRKATTAGVMLIVFGALSLLLGLLLLSLLNSDKNNGNTVSSAFYGAAYLQMVLSVAQIVSGVLVLQGRSWARVLAIVLCGLNLLGDLVSLFSGAGFQGILGVLVNIGLIRLLVNDEVVEWCRRA
jgi:hypothetical protein